MERHYDRIKVVEYLDKLSKIENCILLDSDLEICKNYMAEDFKGDVLVCFRDYTRHFWFRYSFDNNHCTEVASVVPEADQNITFEIFLHIVLANFKIAVQENAVLNFTQFVKILDNLNSFVMSFHNQIV